MWIPTTTFTAPKKRQILPPQLWYQFQYLRYLLSVLGRVKKANTWKQDSLLCYLSCNLCKEKLQKKIKIISNKPGEWWWLERKCRCLCALGWKHGACYRGIVLRQLQQLRVRIRWTEWLHEGNTKGSLCAWGILLWLLLAEEKDPIPVEPMSHESSYLWKCLVKNRHLNPFYLWFKKKLQSLRDDATEGLKSN